MKKATTLLLAAVFALLSSKAIFAQKKDFSKELKKDIATIDAGKYKAVEYMLCQFDNGNTVQIMISASCPIDVMSRDNFISILSTYGLLLLIETFNQAGLDIPDIKSLDELIGDPDITFNIVMSKNGMQIQTITNAGRENLTMRWEDIYQD